MSREYRLLWTGSRAYRGGEELVERSYRAVLERWGCPAAELVSVHGGARGWDLVVDRVGRRLGVQIEDYPVPSHAWRKEYSGNRAGHVRNALMVRLGARGCIACPLGLSPGTRGCMVMAEDAGIRVWNRGEPPIPGGCYQVTDGGVCAGFEVRRGLIVQCAPKLRRERARWWAAVAAGDPRVQLLPAA
jgi:hypothetical protein